MRDDNCSYTLIASLPLSCCQDALETYYTGIHNVDLEDRVFSTKINNSYPRFLSKIDLLSISSNLQRFHSSLNRSPLLGLRQLSKGCIVLRE